MMSLATRESGWAWWLGLETIDPSAGGVELQWQQTVPAWAWMLVVLAAVAAAMFSYRKMLGHRRGRTVLAVVRTATLLVLAVLLAGPVLVLPREQAEESRVLMLLDRSASMAFKDLNASADGPGQALSRDQQLRRLLKNHQATWAALSKEHTLEWYGFGDEIQKLEGPVTEPIPQDGQATLLRSAISESLRQATGRRVGAVVIFSDGRSSEPLGAKIQKRLRQEAESVFVVPLGLSAAPRDLVLRMPQVPRRAFVKDVVPVRVRVDRVGGQEGPPSPGTQVRLVDTLNGAVLDQKDVERFGESVQLRTVPTTPGQGRWKVVLVSPETDLIQHNNERLVTIDLIDRPIRILYIDDMPRWEYRYLKNMMVREPSIASSIMLVSADRTFAQEGDVPLRRLPQNEQELQEYDVVVIGDVRADFFSAEQMSLFYQQVNEKGAGIVWLAGPRHMPSTYVTTQLSALLPMSDAASLTLLPAPIDVQPTQVAQQMGVLRLRSGSEDVSVATWPKHLPSWLWAQQLKTLKPAAQALAEDQVSQSPLVVRMPFGAGMSLYVASDEIWRWRYGRGELYPEQFWIQLFRMLARNRLRHGDDGRARLEVAQRESTVGVPLVVDLIIQDQNLLQNPLDAVDVKMVDLDHPQMPSQRLTLRPAGRRGHLRGVWVPRSAGRMRLTLASPQLGHLGLACTVEVTRLDSEMRYPATDHATLKSLAAGTSGMVLGSDQIPSIPKQIPKPNIKDASIREPLWHSPLVFGVLLVLLAGEWVGRRWLGLA